MKNSIISRATRGLFWKILLAFWLTNFVIMAVTTFVVAKSLDNRKIDPEQKLFILELAREIVWHRESGANMRRQYNERRMVREYVNLRKAHIPPFAIVNRKGEEIFRYRLGMVPDNVAPQEFVFVSAIGNVYRVNAFVRSPKRFILAGLRRLNILQLVLVIIGFALVSLYLSWSIARPLKKLGVASRSFTGGRELSIDESLLKRRDEVGDLSRDFKHMSEQVERNIQNRKQLLHDVSHELRAPLARLQTAAGLIQQSAPEGSKHIDRLHVECEKISTLIQHILDYSRMDHVEPEPAYVDMTAFLQTQIDSVGYEFSSTQITLLSQGEKVRARVFPELLEAALVNVLRNACKHADSSIEIALNIVDGFLVITVRDFGEGVKDEDLEKLLTPFYRANNRMHSGGYGLGLSIAKRAMEKHNGDILLTNHKEGGLVVTLSFPYETDDAFAARN